MFTTNEFGAAPWLTYAILGFLLCVGYLVWRGMSAKSKSKDAEYRPRKRSALEEELQAEINRAREKAAAEKKTEADLALDLPAEERERLARIREQVEGKEEG